MQMITTAISKAFTPIPTVKVPGCVVKSSYNIPMAHVDPAWKRHFVMTPKASGDHAVLPYPIYSETESWLRIPRGVGIAIFGLQDNRMEAGKPMQVIFQGELRHYQKKACQLTTQTLKQHHGALLLACCGAGKTIMAIHLACTFGVCVGIVVHKEFLLTQWKERIAAFCPDATIGIVQQNRCDIGCDFTLFMLHSTISRAYDPTVFSQIGLVVVDECHHISAKYFSQIMRKFPAQYRLGLTATPDRADGLGFALNYFFGPTACQIQRETAGGQQATVQRCFYKDGKQTAITMSNGKLLFAKMITRLVEDEKRNKFVVSQIMKQLKNDKCILVASERRKHLQDLAALLPASISHAFYVGETSKKRKREREKNKEECDVLFTTFQMASEGLDIKRLNCLVMATPKKNIEQVVGRILRKKDSEPVVVDIVDNFSVFAGMAKSRMRFYKAKDFEVVTSKDGREHSPSPTQGRSSAAIEESMLPFLQGKERADQ